MTDEEGGARDGSASDAPGGDASTARDASSSVDASYDAPPSVDGDGATTDSASPDGSSKDAQADANDCDQDGDGYKAKGVCGGTDCCDTDADAHPKQTMFFTSADACGSFDYNCDGTIETETTPNIMCGGTGLLGCTGGPGFTGNPTCGATAPYCNCTGSGALACQATSTMMATQACN